MRQRNCGNFSNHVSDLALLISKEQAIGYCRYYDNHHLEVVKGFFLTSIYKEWGMGMTYHQASTRFLLDRIPLIDRRRSHRVANPDDADDERSDDQDDELASEQGGGRCGGQRHSPGSHPRNTQQPSYLFQFTNLVRCDSFSTLGS